jgi:hypothetical protein
MRRSATAWQQASRVLAIETISMLVGLVLLVVSVRLPTPSLGLFLIGGALIRAGAGAVFKGTTRLVLEASPAESRARVRHPRRAGRCRLGLGAAGTQAERLAASCTARRTPLSGPRLLRCLSPLDCAVGHAVGELMRSGGGSFTNGPSTQA